MREVMGLKEVELLVVNRVGGPDISLSYNIMIIVIILIVLFSC